MDSSNNLANSEKTDGLNGEDSQTERRISKGWQYSSLDMFDTEPAAVDIIPYQGAGSSLNQSSKFRETLINEDLTWKARGSGSIDSSLSTNDGHQNLFYMNRQHESIDSIISTSSLSSVSCNALPVESPRSSHAAEGGNTSQNFLAKDHLKSKKFTRSHLSEDCMQLIKRYRSDSNLQSMESSAVLAKGNEDESSPENEIDSLSQGRKVRSNPRQWRVFKQDITREEAMELLRYHRWKEPVTNTPKGSGCRVSQCAIHAGCKHLYKMRLSTLMLHYHFER